MQEDALLCNQQMKQQKWHKKQGFFREITYTRHKSLIFTKFLEEKNVANFHTHYFIFSFAVPLTEMNIITLPPLTFCWPNENCECKGHRPKGQRLLIRKNCCNLQMMKKEKKCPQRLQQQPRKWPRPHRLHQNSLQLPLPCRQYNCLPLYLQLIRKFGIF